MAVCLIIEWLHNISYKENNDTKKKHTIKRIAFKLSRIVFCGSVQVKWIHTQYEYELSLVFFVVACELIHEWVIYWHYCLFIFLLLSTVVFEVKDKQNKSIKNISPAIVLTYINQHIVCSVMSLNETKNR